MSRNKKYSAIIFAILAAALYAVSTPVSKVLLQSVSPTMVAAFLYLGAGVGMRLALWHPERIDAIISQNGNCYEEGLGKKLEARKEYWARPTPELRKQYESAILPWSPIIARSLAISRISFGKFVYTNRSNKKNKL